MRVDCKHYESRTYATGDTVRKCRLDLAPEAPWRCPDDCPSYVKRRIDAGWQYGSLGESVGAEPDVPEALGPDVAALLDEAEDIINAAGPEALADVEAPKRRKLRLPGRGKKRQRKRKR